MGVRVGLEVRLGASVRVEIAVVAMGAEGLAGAGCAQAEKLSAKRISITLLIISPS